jgi:hypothetical protein
MGRLDLTMYPQFLLNDDTFGEGFFLCFDILKSLPNGKAHLNKPPSKS